MGAPVRTDTGGVHHDIISQMAAPSPLSDSNLYADGAQASHWHELLHTLDPNSGLIANEHWHSQHPQATNTGSLPSHSTSPYTIDPSHSGLTTNLVPLGPGQHQANEMGNDLSGNTNGADYADPLGEGHWK
ncbi:hypothetical protein H0H93_001978 [Arthromyces matolae]|nr:hypothetical protein H0H93_001978 [Arthromyces matolae]